MRMLINITFAHEAFNAAVRNGTAGQTIEKILEAIEPEAVYFTEQEGHRAAIIIVEVEHASQIPTLAEPWFLHFNADCRFQIAMLPEDLQRAGLAELGKKWQ